MDKQQILSKAAQLGELVAIKNEAYGAAFASDGNFLAMLWPDGIKPKDYQKVAYALIVFHKLKRVATQPDAFGENPFDDVAGYSLLMGADRDGRRAEAENQRVERTGSDSAVFEGTD
jgi:hypothetical protein